MIKGFCRSGSEQTTSTTEAVKTSAVAVATGAIVADNIDTTQNNPPKTTEFIDQDNDAISDEDERTLGTDPTNEDSDNDGLKDNEELGIELLSPIDTDNDGIINALDEDDDNDGIPTRLEAQFGSNPLNADSDEDGVNDGDEIGADKTNPIDSDNDGIIDLLDTIDDNAEAVLVETTTEDQNTAPSQDAESDTNPTDAASTEDSSDTQDEVKDEVTVDTSSQPSIQADESLPIQKSRLYFPFRSSNPGLSKAATTYFQSVVTWLNQSPSHSVVLTGHTDDIGKAKNNLDLGLKRAIEIKDMMTKLGANSAQVNVASMGETQPIASNKTDDGRRKNRRVELIPSIKQ